MSIATVKYNGDDAEGITYYCGQELLN